MPAQPPTRPPSCAAGHPVRKANQTAPLLSSRLPPRQAPPPPQAAPAPAGQARDYKAVLDSWPPRPTPWRTKLTLGGGLLLCALVSYLSGSHVVAAVQLTVALVNILLLFALGWVSSLPVCRLRVRLPANHSAMHCIPSLPTIQLCAPFPCRLQLTRERWAA